MIEFRVYSIPAPGGSKRVFPLHTGKWKTGKDGKPQEIVRAIVTDAAGQKNKNWRASVIDACRAVFTSVPLRGPLAMHVTFFLPYRKGDFKTGRNAGQLKESAPRYPVTKPDVLKLMRSTEDALTGILWMDDAQVVVSEAVKLYGLQPGAMITVKEVGV